MAFPQNSEVMVSMHGSCFGQRIILTQWYRKLSAPSGSGSVTEDLAEIVAALVPLGTADIMTAYLACLPAAYTLLEVRAQGIRPIRTAYFHEPVSLPGTHIGSASVANDSACVTLRTANSGRNQIANKHIGPVPDSASASGLIVPAYRAKLVLLGATLVTPFVTGNGDEWVPIIPHGALIGGGDLATNFRVGDQSRVQRRRTVGLGE